MPDAAGRPLRARLTYRDLGGGGLEHHVAGWLGFVWEKGPVQVDLKGKWGLVRVYAASEAEGKRVIRHAAALASYDIDADASHQWFVAVHNGGRLGRSGTMRPEVAGDGIAVTVRQGASGRPPILDLT
jgi:hypothetical protein